MILKSSNSACFGCPYIEERLNGPHCLIRNCNVLFAKEGCDHLHDDVRDSSLLYNEKFEVTGAQLPKGFVKFKLKSCGTIMHEEQLKAQKAKDAAARREQRAAERREEKNAPFAGLLFD